MRSHFLRGRYTGLIYVGGNTAGVATSGTYTIDLQNLSGGVGAGDQRARAGDLIVICNGGTATSNVTFQAGVPDGGFTQLAALYADDTRDANMWVSYKIASGNEGSVTLNGNNTSVNLANAAVVHVWRNAHPTNPIDVTTTTATGTNSARPNVPSITPVTRGAIVLGCGYGTQGATGSALTAPAGTTEVVSRATTASSGSGAAIIAAYRSWTSGAYDMAAFTGGNTSTSDSWCSAAVVIRPFR